MPFLTIIDGDADPVFRRNVVLPPLAALGFTRVQYAPDAHAATPRDLGAAVIVVVTADVATTARFTAAARVALDSTTPVLALWRSGPERPSGLLDELASAATVEADVAVPVEHVWSRLARLLAPADTDAQASSGERTAWHEGAFSVLLTDAVRRDDHTMAQALVARLAAALTRRGPYPADAANRDLKLLRGHRRFGLMADYAAAVLASGTHDFTVRRQFGQALIELKDFERAVEILRALTADTARTRDGRDENHEARGLLGRAFKQRYVDAGAAADPAWLATAVAEYASVFAEDPERVWHGVNAASCLVRAGRDGVDVSTSSSVDEIARRVLGSLADREVAATMQVWDHATRVEALVDLQRFAEAATSLDDYLAHPDLEAFEVSATYRQFTEVLRLDEHPQGRALVDVLLASVTRRRAGGRVDPGDPTVRHLLVQVADPAWAPAAVPDLVVGTRIGTVVTAKGSYRSVAALMNDPLVLSVEQSLPSADLDCARSVPFVQVRPSYTDPAVGSYAESGAHALVAVIDDGIDVLHEAFRDADGRSRIVGIWDQTDPDTEGPVVLGRLHDAAAVAGYVSTGAVPHRLRRTGEHGTHVASIAAGRRCGSFAGGMAPDAKLLVVVSGSAEATGYQRAYVEALAFIDATATALRLPVVVNVSQGLNAGAHDGRSQTESAFSAFCEGGGRPGRVVVKSAGNERDKLGHAKLTVPHRGADDLVWHCPPGGARQVELQLWWDPANTYRFRLWPPAGEKSAWVDRKNQTDNGYVRGHGEYELELIPLDTRHGAGTLRVTHMCGWSDRPVPDEWSLEVESISSRVADDIHAWVERGALPTTTFVHHVTEEMTISVPGTAEAVITVGAITADEPVRVAAFSSFGPTRTGLCKPDVCAPGVGISAALRGSGDGATAKDGTSMAAPHVAGAVALMLSQAVERKAPWPTAAQVQALLHNNTRFDNLYWDRGQGYGVLDVAKLMQVGLPTLM